MRTVIVDSENCNGCGLCVDACHEGVIVLKDGKAVVVNTTACDGFGDCLPACPQNAITFTDTDEKADIMVKGRQWPIQMALVSPTMEQLSKGIINIAADCTAFMVDDFRKRFVRDMPMVIGCPKLDTMDRFDKLETILSKNDIRVVNVLRMQIPCCNMLTRMVNDRVKRSGKDIRINEYVFGIDGSVSGGLD